MKEDPIDNLEVILRNISKKTGVPQHQINRIDLVANEDITAILQAVQMNIEDLRRKQSIDEAELLQLKKLEDYYGQVSNDIKSEATLFKKVYKYWEKIPEAPKVINEIIKETGQVLIHRRIGKRDYLFLTDATKVEEVMKDLDDKEKKFTIKASRPNEQVKRSRFEDKMGDYKRRRYDDEPEGEVQEYINRYHRSEEGYNSDTSERSYRSEYYRR